MNPSQPITPSPAGEPQPVYSGSDFIPGSVNAPNSPGTPGVIPSQQSQSSPNSTQNALQISEIRDGIVIMNDGSFRAVIMVKSINFDLMSPQEQEAVEYS